MHRSLVALALIASSSAAQGPLCTPDLSFLTSHVDTLLASAPPAVDGAGLYVFRDGVVLYERYFGSWDETTAVSIASATKWPTSALLMTLVDEGVLDLDDTVGSHLPAFASGLLGTITLRQCLSHTSGLPDQSTAISDTTISLQQAAAQIASEGLRLDGRGNPVIPGTDFCYGGVSMHVGGAVVELVGGAPYTQLLAQRFAQPLGWTSTGFGPLSGTNPRIAGGLVSTARDYARFLRMLLDSGSFGGQQVLAASVAAILSDQSGRVPVTCSPVEAPPGSPYGLGNWREAVGPDGELLHASSPGAFGFTPWIDTERRIVGIFAVRWQNQAVDDSVHAWQAEIRAAIDACERVAPFCAGDGSNGPCPCGNESPSATGTGCVHSQGHGARLEATGNASVAADTITLRAVGLSPSTSILFFQGAATIDGGLGLAFGDGRRCVGAPIVRLATRTASGANAAYGYDTLDVPVSERGFVPSDGGTRWYQSWYRNSASFCTSATFNLTNGVRITWAP